MALDDLAKGNMLLLQVYISIYINKTKSTDFNRQHQERQ